MSRTTGAIQAVKKRRRGQLEKLLFHSCFFCLFWIFFLFFCVFRELFCPSLFAFILYLFSE